MKWFVLAIEEKANALLGHLPKDYPMGALHGKAIQKCPEPYLFLFLSFHTTSIQKRWK